MSNLQRKLNRYFRKVGIYHVSKENPYCRRFDEFQCCKKNECRTACRNGWNQKERFVFSPPVEPVRVTKNYEEREYCGDFIPRIVVLSLSVPEPEHPCNNGGNNEEQVQYLNPHWRETLAMLRSLLHPFISPDRFPKPVNSHGARDNQILEKLFVHLRSAKCCSNANGKHPEPHEVYENCAEYLRREMEILQPDVIISQGDSSHGIAERNVVDFDPTGQKPIKVKGIRLENSIAHVVKIRGENRNVYWLRSYHPCYFGGYYGQAGRKDHSEKEVPVAKRKNLMLYADSIREFLDSSPR